MKFSICIPNFNYARYIGETIESVLDQRAASDLEVVVSDNASTDGSADVVRSIGDPRVRLQINSTNVGFAANLDRAAAMAAGDVLILLSSDDLMRPGALSAYEAIFRSMSDRVVVGASMQVIDSDGARLGRIGPPAGLWTDAEPHELGADVVVATAADVLQRALLQMRNPFPFASFAYPRTVWERAGGYGGSRIVNPDKWFHWRALGVAETAVFVDRELFAYRWHTSNQSAQQRSSGALKHLVDEYASTFQLDDAVLEAAGLTRAQVERAFVRQDIGLRGLAQLAEGNRALAKRTWRFGGATYPSVTRREPTVAALRALLAAGPVGSAIARAVYGRLRARRAAMLEPNDDLRWQQPVA